MFILIGAIIGLIIGGIGIYVILKPKLQSTKQKDEEIEKINQGLHRLNEELEVEKKSLEFTIDSKRSEINNLNTQKTELTNTLNTLRETQTKAANDYYQQALEIAQNSFDKEIENISCQLEQARNEAEEEYLITLKEAVNNFDNEIEIKTKQLSILKEQLSQEQQNVDTAVEAAIRKNEMETQQDFYKLNLSQEDINEIERLRQVLPYLRDKEPLNKVIYKCYYEKPYTDLIGRVVGQGIHTGIYKITNILNDMCYVGQAANIAERWRQHIKRGVGAETPTRNKLYPAMLEFGVENFTFEVVEECSRDKLNEREDYWQNYFHAKDYGYSIK